MGWSDKHMFVYLVDPKVLSRHQDGLRWSQEGEGASRPLHLHERSGLGIVGLNRQVVEFCSFLANVKSVASTTTLAVVLTPLGIVPLPRCDATCGWADGSLGL